MGPCLIVFSQLALTVLLEGTIMWVWQRSREAVEYSVLCNLMTNPLLNLLIIGMSHLGILTFYINVITLILEALVVIAEMLAYRGMMRISMKKAFLISFVLNVSSYLFGVAIGVLGYQDLIEKLSWL